MVVRATSLKTIVFTLALVAFVWLAGCDKTPQGGGGGTATIVALTGADIKADGTLSDQGLKKIQDKSADSDVTVAFVRSKISDGALVQLAKFPNIHRIEAIGSTLTDPALAKLKATNSNVVVVTQ